MTTPVAMAASMPLSIAASGPILRLHHVQKTFGGVTAIEGFSLDLHAGEVVALVGDNGASGSTVLFASSTARA